MHGNGIVEQCIETVAGVLSTDKLDGAFAKLVFLWQGDPEIAKGVQEKGAEVFHKELALEI